MKKKFLISVALSSLIFAYDISAGYEDYFVVDKSGDLYAWGYNEYGELGDGSTDNKTTLEKIYIDTNITQVSAEWYHSLALNKDGEVYAWGYNEDGELGDGTTDNKTTPEKIDINTTIRSE